MRVLNTIYTTIANALIIDFSTSFNNYLELVQSRISIGLFNRRFIMRGRGYTK